MTHSLYFVETLFNFNSNSSPEEMVGGARILKQLNKLRRKREDLYIEADDAASRKSAAAATMEALDAKKSGLTVEADQVFSILYYIIIDYWRIFYQDSLKLTLFGITLVTV